jgi:UDP-N-acetyl-D-mannosaminuronic acid dehydrogenase
MNKKKICIVGGAGHIGFPLGLVLAKKNSVYLYDINKNNCEIINKGKSPFFEESSENYIKKYKKNYLAGQDTNFIKNSDVIIITLSTPVKKNKPDLKNFFTTINYIKKFINKNQLIIIRSSVFPGSIKKISYIFMVIKILNYVIK